MTIARAKQVCLRATPYYHCISRCVRRAFLCGRDRLTGRSFEHRRSWIENRLKFLSSVFAIDLCAYAVMSNHYHVVIRIDETRAKNWTSTEVIRRWLRLYKGPVLIQRYLDGETISIAEAQLINEFVEIWRNRLMEIGWFMRNLNEPVAREANDEDNCKGRFWEGRYKCQALLDESALLKCMAYVDLNPVRAGKADTPESSDYTSVKARIAGDDRNLVPFLDQTRPVGTPSVPLPYSLSDYLELLDWTGRAIRADKRGIIPLKLKNIFKRLKTNDKLWISEIRYYRTWYGRAIGSGERLKIYLGATGTRWVKCLSPRPRRNEYSSA